MSNLEIKRFKNSFAENIFVILLFIFYPQSGPGLDCGYVNRICAD